jgi:hypothetical protein
MRVFTNTDIIETRSKWARRVAPLTMIFLVGGLVTNFLSINQPQYFRLTLLLLALGFIFATISSYLVNRWVREPRADQVLVATLKKLGNDYLLFNYTSATSHVLLTPSRLYAIVVKNHDGQITVNGSRFSRKFTWGRLFRFFGEEGLGAPVAQVENAAGKLHKLLIKNLSEDELPEIRSLIIFSNKNVELTVNEPPIPVLRSNQLRSYVRENDKYKNISAAQRQVLTQILGAQWEEARAK